MSNRAGSRPFNPAATLQPPLDTPLAKRLAARIQQHGPLSFHEWMRACLYDPQHGYYRSGRPTVGRDGDFLTSPEVHPLFGAAVAHLAAALAQQLDIAAGPFRLAEIGPGTGALAEALLRHLHQTEPALAVHTHYTLIEQSRPAAAQQQARLRPLHPAAQLHQADALSGEHHFVFANELLDALPVHRLQFQAGRWQELRVQHTPALGFHDQLWAIPVDLGDNLLEPLKDIDAAEGQIAEVSLDRAQITETLAHSVAPGGLLLFFDYGYPRARLYAPWRRGGTLLTFRRHVPGDDPYAHPGEQDLTCHIDLDQIAQAARAGGLTLLPVLSQSEWLLQLGAARLPAAADARADGLDAARYLAARRAADTLTDPAELGRISVLAHRRPPLGAPLPGWDGFPSA